MPLHNCWSYLFLNNCDYKTAGVYCFGKIPIYKVAGVNYYEIIAITKLQ